MSKTTDILLDENGDISFANKDIVVGHSLQQNQYLILIAQKGEWKEYPFVGAGISDMSNDDDVLFWKNCIREELKRDGMNVENIEFDNDKVYINANY